MRPSSARPAAGYSVSLAVMLVVYLLALQAFVARQPFDIAEAEIEILEGPFIEYSGPDYALFKYYMMMKQMFYAWLFVAVFLPVPPDGHLRRRHPRSSSPGCWPSSSSSPWSGRPTRACGSTRPSRYYAVLILVALGRGRAGGQGI